jgi:hypothetical protein
VQHYSTEIFLFIRGVAGLFVGFARLRAGGNRRQKERGQKKNTHHII